MIPPLKLVLTCLLVSISLSAQVPRNGDCPNRSPLPDAPSASATQSPARATPNEAAPYVPLTRKQKAERWAHHTYSPYTFTSVLLGASWAQAMGDWPTYGGGMEGFGKRFGATLANRESGGFFKVFLLPTLLHQDPRYFRSAKKGVKARAWYATTRVLVTRNDSGQNEFNFSGVAGSALTSALTNAYYPSRNRGFSNTMSRFSGTLFSDAGANLLREFWPDIRRVFRKHAPEKVKDVEERIPESIEKAAVPPEDK